MRRGKVSRSLWSLVPCEETHKLKRGDKRTGSKKGDKKKRNKSVDGEYYAVILGKILKKLISHPDFKDADDIWVQDDNAPAHSTGQDCVQKVWDKYSKTTPRVIRRKQPPKSPDTNVCDMNVFNWMQQQVDLDDCDSRGELEKSVKKAWKNLSSEHIGRMFKKKSDICEYILETKGGNHYRNF